MPHLNNVSGGVVHAKEYAKTLGEENLMKIMSC